jgi:ectoine hydroxylase-related dioxygenase (phytanoyl-CoA dioxygenase family)
MIANTSSRNAGRTLLTAAQCDYYRRDGFLVVRRLFEPEVVRAIAAEAEALPERLRYLIDTRNLRCRWQNNVESGECTFETFDPVIDLSPGCRSLALAPRLLEVLGDLYGEPACLFKDKLIFKPPGVKGYGLHQDWIAWPGFPRSFLTVLVPLESATRDNGCTEVFPGYHQHGSLSAEDGDYHELSTDLVDESRGVLLELEPGDVAIFDGFTPHRSAPNRSERFRRQLYLSYNKLSDGGEQREKHYAEFHAWLRKKYAQYGKTEIYFE